MHTIESPNYEDLIPGQLIYLMNDEGYQQLAREIREADDADTQFHFNHPMDGHTLTCELELLSREPYTGEEA